MDNIKELFEENSSKNIIIQYIIYLFKKIFCILTIKQNNICILPYKRIKSKIIIRLVAKIILKITDRIVLSDYLTKIDEIEEEFNRIGIYVHNGEILKKYLIYNFIDYISKNINKETHTQEVFLLVNKLGKIEEDIIINLSNNFKRINIVTKNIKQFRNLETYLEEKLGIAITITNNKRKSLLKAKIIINMDFDEEIINSFNLNSKAIIIQLNKEIYIQSKLFNGINILDYQITYKAEELEDIEYGKFNKKALYEAIIYGKKYETIISKIEKDNLKIVNLIGRNGVINKKEYDILV